MALQDLQEPLALPEPEAHLALRVLTEPTVLPVLRARQAQMARMDGAGLRERRVRKARPALRARMSLQVNLAAKAFWQKSICRNSPCGCPTVPCKHSDERGRTRIELGSASTFHPT
jgi:hypothetical protein